jgi:hypothetical protein
VRKRPEHKLELTAPWKPDEQCPCGSGRPYANCCLRFDGQPYKTPVGRTPKPPATCHSHERCYMRRTMDCGTQISREHPVSAGVLSHLGGRNVKLRGVPWLAASEAKDFPITALASNILCKRHNEAFSKLDEMAERFFSAISSIHKNVLSKTKSPWYLFSGEELELWLLKTAIGMFSSGTVAKDQSKLINTQSINDDCYDILSSGKFRLPCGLYVEALPPEQANTIQFQPASDTNTQRMIGLKLTYLSFALTMLFDPDLTYGPDLTDSKTYRPHYLVIREAQRTHTVRLTWPLTISTEQRVVGNYVQPRPSREKIPTKLVRG